MHVIKVSVNKFTTIITKEFRRWSKYWYPNFEEGADNFSLCLEAAKIAIATISLNSVAIDNPTTSLELDLW